MKKFLSIVLLLIMYFTVTLMITTPAVYASDIDETVELSDSSAPVKGDEVLYSKFLSSNQSLKYRGETITYSINNYADLSEIEEVSQENSFGYSSSTIAIDSENPFTFNINASDDGLYVLILDYYFTMSNKLTVEADLMVNNEYQYYEAKQIVFKNEWIPESTTFKTDRYGNEIVPTYNRLMEWYSEGLYTGSKTIAEPLNIYLEKGNNTLTLNLNVGSLLIGNIYLKQESELPTYEEYIGNYSGVRKIDKLIKINAEDLVSKTDLSVRLGSSTDPASSRYDTNDLLLNSINHDSFSKGNQEISYTFTVPETGLYNMSFKYMQTALIDLPTQRNIYINGEIPYQELENYEFDYAKKWTNTSLNKDGEKLYLYFEKGVTYTLSLQVTLDIYSFIIEDLDRIMEEMTDMSLRIKYLTNGQTDEYRSWKITTYIPELSSEINRWISEIEDIIEYGNQFASNKKKDSSSFSSLTLAIKKLEKLNEDPDQVPNDIGNFTDGTSSVTQMLGSTITTFSTNSLGIEMIYLNGENTKLPRARANIFVRFWEGLKKLVISYFNKEYQVGQSDDDELEIWVNRSRQYIEIMQRMADEAGIKVTFSIMPDETKLILANASGDLPDVAMGINNWINYDLAIRGVTTDLRQFDGYEEVVSHLSKGALIPYVYQEGMYGLPESQDFWVTFYRSDILNNINMTVPDTWEELVDNMYKLKSNGLSFYSPISSYTGLKPFVATLPLFYQYGGSLYADDGMSTTLNSEENIEALKFMTNLFTIYDIPIEVTNFYSSFRYGTLPIGIANSATYVQLLIAAPEISGNWDITLHLGVENSEGEVVRYSSTGSQGITMFESSDKKELAWDFIEWWMSTETQTSFIETLYSMYGYEYLWFTSNNDAFDAIPISTAHKKVIKEQWTWAAEATRIPASYMVERSISNAFTEVVYNNANVRIALDDAVILANREIERKMTEFGYIVDGVKVKDYVVPTVYNIDHWLTERGGE